MGVLTGDCPPCTPPPWKAGTRPWSRCRPVRRLRRLAAEPAHQHRPGRRAGLLGRPALRAGPFGAARRPAPPPGPHPRRLPAVHHRRPVTARLKDIARASDATCSWPWPPPCRSCCPAGPGRTTSPSGPRGRPGPGRAGDLIGFSSTPSSCAWPWITGRVTASLGQVRASAPDAFAYQHVPFERVVDAVQPDPDTSPAPCSRPSASCRTPPPQPAACPAWTSNPSPCP